MKVSATAKYVRISPSKLVLVARAIRRMPIEKAVGVLSFLQKGGSQPMQKVLQSAVANAKNNFGIRSDDLVVADVQVHKAPTMKRIWMRGQGRADRISKRMSHITIILEEKV
jgi:large subunit ribosomal protein L22